MIVRLLQAVAFAVGFRTGYRWRRRRQARQIRNQYHPYPQRIQFND